MNLGRRRNVFTLGEFHTKLESDSSAQKNQTKRRLGREIFERDPFKVQSYNFRYAERPSYPVQPAPQPPTVNSANAKTVFYNYDFTADRHNKESVPANAFHEHRRRKFLQDFQASSSMPFAASCSGSRSQQRTQHQPQTNFQSQLTAQYQQQSPHCNRNSNNNRNQNLYGGSAMYANSYNYNGSSNCMSYAGAASHGGPKQCTNRSQQSPHRSRERVSGLFDISTTGALGAQQSSAVRGGGSSHTSIHRCRSPGEWRLSADNGRGHVVGHFGCIREHTPSCAQHCGQKQGNAFDSGSKRSAPDVGVLDEPSTVNHHDSHITLRQQRRSLPSIYAPTKALVNPPLPPDCMALERKLSNSSVCQININIQSANESQSNGNVTIKIGTDNTDNAGNAYVTHNPINAGLYSANYKTLRMQSPSRENTFNRLSRSQSTNTLVIDKYISKYALKCQEGDEKRPIKRTSLGAVKTIAFADKQPHSSNNARPDAAKRRQPSGIPDIGQDSRRLQCDRNERMPSLLPWRLDYTSRDVANDKSTTNFRRIRASYMSCVHDLHALRKFNDIQYASRKEQKPQAAALSPERKLLNTVNWNRQLSDYNKPNKKHMSASVCLAKNIENSKGNKTPNELRRSNTPRTRSESRLQDVNSNHLTTAASQDSTPVKVNINVYTDNLKLLHL